MILFLSRCTSAVDDESSDDNSDKTDLTIFLLIGQSNIAGRAEIEAQDQDTLQNVFLFTGTPERQWEKAANPLNKYSTVRKELSMQKLSFGYTFAREMSETLSPKKIGLVVNARGGTPIVEWMPGTKLYQAALARARSAMKSGTLRGVLWHQGASDAGKNSGYMEDLITLIQAIRSDLGIPALPFIAGKLGESSQERIDFNNMIDQLTGRLPYTAVISADNLTTFDGAHFDSQSQRVMGKRYAYEMAKMIE